MDRAEKANSRPQLAVLFVTLLTNGCDDHVIRAEGPITAEGFCGVEQVLEQSCTSGGCHDATSAAGGLDLESSPYEVLTTGQSPVYDASYVVPGDAAGSFFYQKIAGTQGDRGSRMPIGSALSDEAIALVESWIDNGASECGGAR